jgi:hypothetical protein
VTSAKILDAEGSENTAVGSSSWLIDNTADAFTFHLQGATHRMTLWSFSQVRPCAVTNLSLV